jgi:hypothetical protein
MSVTMLGLGCRKLSLWIYCPTGSNLLYPELDRVYPCCEFLLLGFSDVFSIAVNVVKLVFGMTLLTLVNGPFQSWFVFLVTLQGFESCFSAAIALPSICTKDKLPFS